MPVFNRLAHTQKMIECLRSQEADEDISITVVDDGSTDGTSEYLQAQTDIKTIQGDGNLWWGGAIELGLKSLLGYAARQDWIMFINNDTQLPPDFVQRLLDAGRAHAPAAVGSVVRDVAPPHSLLSAGPRVDFWRLTVKDRVPQEDGPTELEVDALSGRGVLYPATALRQVKGMRPGWLPHYLADYEVSVRVQQMGYKLLVCTKAAVYSKREFGSAHRATSLRERLFSVRSPTYLPAQIRFWWIGAGPLGKISLPLRLLWRFAGNRNTPNQKVL